MASDNRYDTQPSIVGRDSEREQLRACLARALAGHESLALVSGEAGIGKTTLVQDLARHAAEQGYLALTGSCYDLTTTPPYGPWIECLRAYPQADNLPELPEQLRTGGGMAGIDSQAALFDLFERFVDNVTRVRPLILILEDIHWADPGSLNLLRQLARTLTGVRALVVATYRSDEITPQHELFRLLPSLVRESQAYRLGLAPLDRPHIVRLLQERYKLAPDDERRLTAYLLHLAEGNPFFTMELLYALEEQRVMKASSEGWSLGDLAEIGVPALIHQVISRRLVPLQPAARTLLDLAAVLGHEAPLTLLRDIQGGTDAELDDALQHALDRGLLRLHPDRSSVRFTHALVRQNIYEAIPPLRCQSLHRRAGELLAASNQHDPNAVANHFLHAVDQRAVPWLNRAAEQAAKLFAPETVITRCNQAIELSDRLGEEPPLTAYQLRGLARETIGDFDGSRDNYETARKLARARTDRRAEWQALLDLGGLWASRDYATSRDYLLEALELARSIGNAAITGESLNRLGNWYANQGQYDNALRHHREALDVFERLDHLRGIAATHDLIGMTHAMSGDARRGIEAFDRAIPLLRQLDTRQTLVSALMTRSLQRFGNIHAIHASNLEHHRAGPHRERVRDQNEAIQLAREIGWRAGEAFSLGFSADAACLFGEYDRALEHGQQAIQIADDIQHRQWLTMAACALGNTYLELFATGQALEHLQRAYDLAFSHFWKEIASALLATVHLALDEYDLAEERLRSITGEPGPQTGLGNRFCWFVLIELRLAQGELDRAHSMLEQFEALIPGPPEQRSPHVRELRGRVLMAGGQLADAERELHGARYTAARFDFKPMLWRTLATLHSLLLEQGRLDEATEARRAALQVIDELAGKLEDGDLRQTFVTSARSRLPGTLPFTADRGTTTSFGGLTKREIDVLQLVASGMTNIAVSEELFISPRTVSQHLHSIYAKLEVSNRTEATRIAIEHDLI